MQKALEILIERLKDMEYGLIGSYNLKFQGVEIEPHDLDILTNDEDIQKIAKIFSSQIKVSNGYKETEFKINNIDVHIVSCVNNPLRPNDLTKEIVRLEKDDLKIPCVSLQSEINFYSKSGREKDILKVDLIKSALKK